MIVRKNSKQIQKERFLDYKNFNTRQHLDVILLKMLGTIFFYFCLVIALMLVTFSSATIECVVVGRSMIPTFNNDIRAGRDTVYVNTLSNEFSFGDIIVLEVGEADPIIKRVIGVSGDVIDIVFVEDVGYKLEINGNLIDEDYLRYDYDIEDETLQNGMGICHDRFKLEMQANYPELFINDKLVVPEGHIFALGDNRHESKDSTSYGTFEENAVIGKVELVRKAGVSEWSFYWDYIWDGKVFNTIATCFE